MKLKIELNFPRNLISAAAQVSEISLASSSAAAMRQLNINEANVMSARAAIASDLLFIN